MYREPLTDDTIHQIASLYRQGWGTRSISEQLDMPYGTVENVLRGKTRASQRVLGGRLMHGKRPGRELAIYRGSK